MITLSILCLAAVVIAVVVLAILSAPIALILGLLPWLLRLAAVVLLVKALLEKPSHWKNFMPAVGAFAASIVLGWIF